MMSTLIHDEAQNTRQRILDAAIEVFSRKGYHDTRVDDIVEASGTSKGGVYFYFRSKQEIFLALIDEFAVQLERAVIEAILRETEGIQRVNAALSACLDVFHEYHHLAKIFLIQAVGLGQVFEEKRMNIHQHFEQAIKLYLDKALADGDIPPIDTEVAALAWMGAINEVVIRWVLTGQPEPARALPALRTILLRSIGVPEERIQSLEASAAH
jgi:TetR/AcrR family transcriptional regulator, fatty acid metabolism regulator protein